jgi:hypothetical protein
MVKVRQEADKLLIEYQNLVRQEEATKLTYEQEQEAEYRETLKESQNKAVKFYPDTSDKNSAITKRMVEIDNELNEMDNDLYHDPDKPFIIAQMAARELGIAPNSKRQPATQGTKSTNISPFPASGRQSTQAGSETKKISHVLELDNLDDYEDAIANMKIN